MTSQESQALNHLQNELNAALTRIARLEGKPEPAKPREWWLTADRGAYESREHAVSHCVRHRLPPPIHVREVL